MYLQTVVYHRTTVRTVWNSPVRIRHTIASSRGRISIVPFIYLRQTRVHTSSIETRVTIETRRFKSNSPTGSPLFLLHVAESHGSSKSIRNVPRLRSTHSTVSIEALHSCNLDTTRSLEGPPAYFTPTVRSTVHNSFSRISTLLMQQDPLTRSVASYLNSPPTQPP